ncbi:MAG: ABC transporter ATP-binding protein [Chitinophagaceae bacterium]
MKDLKSLNPYFWKYRWRLFLGILFILISNYFGVLAPQMTGFVVDQVSQKINPSTVNDNRVFFDPLVKAFVDVVQTLNISFSQLVMLSGLTLLSFALFRGFFMFLMRQTIIVMSRHIEYDQKNDVYAHYQKLDTQFYKVHSTGDLMSRMSEDVSRVRMYTGPALMYLVNLTIMIVLSLFYMFKKDVMLSVYVLLPLPFLAVAMYFVNALINKKSEQIQSQLSDLTTLAQESYSGIRVIKSYGQEKANLKFFDENAEAYRKSGLSLSTMEAIYFPAIGLLIGLSTLITIYIGSLYQIEHKISAGTIAEFVIYINMLTFPVSAIGWVATNIQRAAASQKRLNEFLDTVPALPIAENPQHLESIEELVFDNVNFIYPHTGIHAIKDFSFQVKKGEKVAILGKTGCGKSTIAQLAIRLFDPVNGKISINGIELNQMDLENLRSQISYVPQDVFLFSDTIKNNINFGSADQSMDNAVGAAEKAAIRTEIESLPNGFETWVGERGVTLSGGQKQRISIARALSKQNELLIFDDCLSAVDAKTEHRIAENLNQYLSNKTAIIITHRIFPSFKFNQIIVMDDGKIIEKGTHDSLLAQNGAYAELLRTQQIDH